MLTGTSTISKLAHIADTGRRLVIAIYLAISATSGAVACGAASGSTVSPQFPLRISPARRYLETVAGQPFFIHGDTAWSLIAQLKREEVKVYLRDRASRGFNTLLVNLLEHQFASNAPANAYGDRPFLIDGDYAQINDVYFEHAEWVVRRACELGLVVLLVPSYAGFDGGPEGWYREMINSGHEKLFRYGLYLGRRFGKYPNIIWVHGGDYNPPDKELTRALVRGIQQFNPDALHTAHGSPNSPALDYWRYEPWLSINNIYTYEPVFGLALQQNTRTERSPFFLIESMYENEHGARGPRVRMQAYQAILSGASGHIFGNNPIWHFASRSWHERIRGWKRGLDTPGVRSMDVLQKLIVSRPWWLLRPDSAHSFLIDGIGPTEARAVAARAEDGSFALVYLPTNRTVVLDVEQLSGPAVLARWHDPATGEVSPAVGVPLPRAYQSFHPMKKNSAGEEDWVLELYSLQSSEGR